ncbi:MAG: DUF2924 domain-containing protein [Afipia sp.]|uniref:DUF2924 domain-containing protein n=1 Tax=Candidatus Afipia apatlaquensis TaxID=2712852 RepID=A0A7C9VQJ7_9BRAD|nr:DUF2924 domain-containing protein [Afipia sp.]MBQ8102628.1 DUF2924 domain-containing protein [Afipia sp.]NGX99295.1 DUF2924 domain-containing protein [Candidatus Afipia apatlaquensis]
MSDISRKGEAELEAEIEQIRSLPVDQLRVLWRQTFKSPPPSAFARDMLGRMICYHMQEKALGGLGRASRRLLDNIGEDKPEIETARRRLKSGTVLVREYQGERHSVVVASDGFVWREETYASLSIIARLITGTNWNGPKFFGLRLSIDKSDNIEAATLSRPRRSKRSAL